MAHSAIVVPVTALEPLVRPRLARSMPSYLFADPASVHAHVTLLGPFVDRGLVDPALLDRLRVLFGGVAPVPFTLTAPVLLGDSAIGLPVAPAGPFRALTAALWREFPAYPPYAEPSREVLPHLTVEYAPRDGAMAEITAELAPRLPVPAIADTACLNWYAPGGSTTLGCFPFRGAAPLRCRPDRSETPPGSG